MIYKMTWQLLLKFYLARETCILQISPTMILHMDASYLQDPPVVKYN
mgnify:CR=1 FL=1